MLEIRIVLSNKKGPKHEDLIEEQTDWLKELRDRSNMTSINPGKGNHIYIGKLA